MSIATRLSRAPLAALVLFFSFSLSAADPWDAPAFSAAPAALLEAAAKVDAKEHAYVILLDEGRYTFDDARGSRSVSRMMYRIEDQSAVEYMGTVVAGWSPWYSDRPKIEARVVTRDGTVHTLDQGAVTESPAGDSSADIFSDNRVLRAPLPAVEVGSVVEYTITLNGRNPIESAGTIGHFIFGLDVPVQRARLVLDAPPSFEPRVVNTTTLQPRVEEREGRRISTWEMGPLAAIEDYEGWLPYDVDETPYVAFSTGSSWKDIAARYAAIVDEQIAGSELQKAVRAAVGNAKEPREIVARLLASIQKDIRYAGVEVGEGSIIPRPPKTVLQNKYGDCKDKATLLVAMLREAGLTANVALLRAGYDFDASDALPGLGMFNHAIVRVENGDAPIWVDPTDIFSRAGELPIQDQGRMALIASAETTTLTKTPEAPSTANLYREVRTFTLPESGKAKVTELSEYTGHAEAALRRQFDTAEPKELRETLEDYAKNAYVAKGLERQEAGNPRDLTKPFRLTLEVNESKSGVVDGGEGAVAINLGALLDLLPSTLRDREDAKVDDDPKKAKKRKNDFLFTRPSVREWSYRIIPPAGYVPRKLAENETRQLGSVTFSQQLSADENGIVTATFRVDSGKRRLTPAEYEETRVAVSKFAQSPTFLIGFDSVGQAKLNAGDVGGALTEYRRLAQLHPKHAQHRIEMARALLAGGLGEAAREEARRAVAIEPSNAEAHRALGFVLQHDLLGRPFRRGFDLAGAVAAFRKAAELDPKNVEYRYEHVQLLERGEDGRRFGRNAPLKEAIAAMLQLVEDFEAEGKPYEPELTLLYAHTGDFAKLRELSQKLTDKRQKDLARLISTAVLDGIPALQRELGAFDLATRRSYASGISQNFMQLRRYPEAAAMIETAVQGTENASSSRAMLEVLSKARRLDATALEPKPENLLVMMVQAGINQDRAALERLFPQEWLERSARKNEDILGQFDDQAFGDEIPMGAVGDIVAAMLEVKRDGDEAIGYRVRAEMPAVESDEANLTMFVEREGDRYVFTGVDDSLEYVGVQVLRMAARGELDRARIWLNWLRDDAKAGSGDDPLSGMPLAALWTKGKTAATIDEIRLAAASVVDEYDFVAEAEPVLLEARAKSGSDATRAQIDLALMKLYEEGEVWPKMAEVTTRLLASHPDSPTAFSQHVKALLRTGKRAEVEKLAQERLARIAGDVDATRALSASAADARDYAAAQTHATKLIDELRPNDGDYKTAAWYALFTGKELERALQFAERSSKAQDEAGKKKKDAKVAALRTLAALLAESGKNVEARQTLLSGMDASLKSEPTGIDWYVLGRIAENYGVTDAAIAAYKRVPKENGSATTWELAERRLAKLAKKQ